MLSNTFVREYRDNYIFSIYNADFLEDSADHKICHASAKM